MKRSDRAKEVNKILNRIYKKVPIPLKHNNKFELLIAVLLSAQCTDERVNQVTPILFKLANPLKKTKSDYKKRLLNVKRFLKSKDIKVFEVEDKKNHIYTNVHYNISIDLIGNI